jgi:tartrate dehydratase beta subunit/fumarate hydratase class I family protein
VASWKPGDTLLLNGKMLTGRDAAHKRIKDMLAKGEKLPVDFTNRVIYYVARWIRWATRRSAPPAPPPPRAWTASPR